MMPRKVFPFPVIALVMAMVVVSGSIIVGYYLNVSVGTVGPSVYLADGKDYQGYNSSGQFQASEYGNPLNIVNNTTIYFNETLGYFFGLFNDTLAKALQINNTLNSKVYLWINGTLPGSISMYYGYTKNLGTEWTSGQKITLKKNKDMNIGFVVPAFASGTGQLTFTYNIENAIIVVYNYNVSANLL